MASEALRAVVGVAALALGACSRPLPDAESPGARAYAEQCGICHTAYAPGSLTPAMWEVQMARMDELRLRRGLAPLDATQRRLILGYLSAHGG